MGVGVAMKNSVDSAKRAADEITDTNDNDGISKWLKKNILCKKITIKINKKYFLFSDKHFCVYTDIETVSIFKLRVYMQVLIVVFIKEPMIIRYLL